MMVVVPDLSNREAVGRPPQPCMEADIVTGAPTMAWFRKRPVPEPQRHFGREPVRLPRHSGQARLEPAVVG